jgi:hypothetical protein
MQAKHSRGTKLLALLSAVGLVLLCGLAAHSVLLRGQAARAAKAKSTDQNTQTAPNRQTSMGAPSADQSDDSASDDGPSPGNFLGSTYVPSNLATDMPGAPGTMAALPPPPVPKPADAGGDPARQQINDETASLLAMAYALKAEVDKTNKDQLSINVVRKANQIEQLARKVRDEMRPVLSKN